MMITSTDTSISFSTSLQENKSAQFGFDIIDLQAC
jgi:hypothetical protein